MPDLRQRHGRWTHGEGNRRLAKFWPRTRTGRQLALEDSYSPISFRKRSLASGLVSRAEMPQMIFCWTATTRHSICKLNLASDIASLRTIYRALGNATPCMTTFSQGQSAAHRLFTTIKRTPEIDRDDKNGKQIEDIAGDVELKDVYFSYPARPDQLIFDGFSLHVSTGTTMAIVGESGSGKSTVISLVERFYDPHAGEVLIDGINIKSLQLDSIRQKMILLAKSLCSL